MLQVVPRRRLRITVERVGAVVLESRISRTRVVRVFSLYYSRHCTVRGARGPRAGAGHIGVISDIACGKSRA